MLVRGFLVLLLGSCLSMYSCAYHAGISDVRDVESEGKVLEAVPVVRCAPALVFGGVEVGASAIRRCVLKNAGERTFRILDATFYPVVGGKDVFRWRGPAFPIVLVHRPKYDRLSCGTAFCLSLRMVPRFRDDPAIAGDVRLHLEPRVGGGVVQLGLFLFWYPRAAFSGALA